MRILVLLSFFLLDDEAAEGVACKGLVEVLWMMLGVGGHLLRVAVKVLVVVTEVRR